MNGLIRNNVLGLIKKEPVCFFAVTIVASVMSAFNSMVFADDVKEICSQASLLAALLVFSDGVIIIVNSWLIHYIMEYILNKRSKEFMVYMSVGIKRQEIFWIYVKETFLQACVSWVAGLISGAFLQQFIMDIFYHLFRLSYKTRINFNLRFICFSFIIYIIPYIIALAVIRRKFMHMEIEKLLMAGKKTGQERSRMHLKKGGKFNTGLLENNRLFLYRTVVTGLKTMKRPVVITVLLLSCSLAGSTIAMFYNDYLERHIDIEFPYSLMVYHNSKKPCFEKERKVLKDNGVKIESEHEYIIYRNQSQAIKNLLYKHLDYFSGLREENGSVINRKVLNNNPDYDVYYKYDTYMKLSDYNKLREMLGLPAKELKDCQYILQVKHRISGELPSAVTKKIININGKKSGLAEMCTDDFGQNGHNGADYIIIVPDNMVSGLKPYFTVYTVQADGRIPAKTSNYLREVTGANGNFKYGSNHSILFTSPILLNTEIEKILKQTILVLVFPFAYISVIFLCAALTVLSVQVLSGLDACIYRYQVLYKLGMNQLEIERLVHKHLALIFLIPAVAAVFTGGAASLYINSSLIYNTGVYAADTKYLILSLFWILVIYLVFYILTDVIFVTGIKKSIYLKN